MTVKASSRVGLTELWARLAMDERGRIVLDGQRIVIIPASVFASIEAAGERILGRGIASILYLAGERFGREVTKDTEAFMEGSLPPKSILDFLIAGGAMRGFGHFDMSQMNFEAGTGVVSSADQPFPEDPIPRKDPGCHFTAGFWGGVISALRGRDVTLEESSCRGLGAPLCEFVVRNRSV